ncbi:hypothetical protein HZH68_013070 [Vespula germanica]|uniref:Uncharacterized protein n=1 Tax=Vespula germanica TaxID=30212 RepID=A0A834MY90_VESGE|nr:hypothetical protein HZH68_013070 [Vespula germanica]
MCVGCVADRVQDNYFIMLFKYVLELCEMCDLVEGFNENNKNIIFLRKYYSHCNGELEPFHKSVPVAKDHNNSDSSNAALLEISPVNSTEPITHEKVQFHENDKNGVFLHGSFFNCNGELVSFCSRNKPWLKQFRDFEDSFIWFYRHSLLRTSSIIYRYDIDDIRGVYQISLDVTRFHKILPRSYQILPDFTRILYISSDLTKLHQNTPYIFRFLRNSPFFSRF